MRRFSFVLMIALLLLRGWMGEAMATGMALTPLQPQPSATQAVAAHTHAPGTQMHVGHEPAEPEAFHHAQAVHDCAGDPASDEASDADHAHCVACQVCHTVALAPSAPGTHPAFSARALPRATAAFFASADTAIGQKPPIS
jgi:hypothetical protein